MMLESLEEMASHRLKIVVVHSGLRLGGPSVKLVDLMNLAAKTRGVELTLIVRRLEGEFSHKVPPAVRIVDLRCGTRFWDGPILLLKLIRTLRRLEPDAVVGFGDYMSSLSLLAKTIVRSTFRVFVSEETLLSNYLQMQRFSSMRRLLVSVFYQRADKIFVSARAQRRDLINFFRIDPERIVFLFPWVRQTIVCHQPLPISLKKVDVLYVGRLEPEKRLDVFLNIVRQLRLTLPKLSVSIVGSGSRERHLQTLAARFDLASSVKFVGFTEDVSNFYRRAKVFLLPSGRHGYEGQPLSVLEAMWTGVPAVVLDFPGAEELVFHGKTGFIAKSPRQAVFYLRKLLKDPSLRRRIGESGKIVAHQRFGPRNCKRFLSTVIKLATP